MLSAFKKLNYIIEHYNKGMQKLYWEVLRKNEQDVKNDTFTKRWYHSQKKKCKSEFQLETNGLPYLITFIKI